MRSFEDSIQIEEGYDHFTIYDKVYDKEKRLININYTDLSNSFEKIMLQRRENKRLLPLYKQMDYALEQIATPLTNNNFNKPD